MTVESPPQHTHHASPTHEPPAVVRAMGIVIALTLGLAVLFIAFGLPAVHSAPRDLPIGIAAPQAVVSQIDAQLEQKAPSGFAVTTYRDDAALRAAILDREVYGGIVASPGQGTTLMLATGGSPMVAQLLTPIGDGIAAHSGTPLHTVDLAPLPPDDPRGAGLAASALPLTLAGLLPAVVLVLLFPQRVWLRFAATVVFAGAAALTIAAVLRYVFGSIEANFWGVTAGLTLGALATGLTLLGLGSLFGKVGLGVGTAVAMLLGNPLSGLASAPQMLPSGWGTLGQALPQGANGTLLRSTAYFSGAGATTAIIVLTCWAVAGAVMIVIAGLRQESAARA
ncbi:hypothetical protein [Mycobacterium sp. URHB0044]|uniref:hypothetical protein n=1 Tax=Mycobacterium sp. URHB0044 TaxID=1380386 RepID=UPI00048F759E|nr:hypothetical protein [Mycobacterium sp. URHB0044]